MKKVLVGAFALTAFAALGYFATVQYREAPAKASFANLRRIGGAVGLYVADADGWVPPYHTARTSFSDVLQEPEPVLLVRALTRYGARAADFLPPGEPPLKPLDDLQSPDVCGYPLDPFLSMKKFTGEKGSLRFGAQNAGTRPYLGDGQIEAGPGQIRTRYGAVGTCVYPDGEVRFERYKDLPPDQRSVARSTPSAAIMGG